MVSRPVSLDLLGNLFIFTPFPMKRFLAAILFVLYFTSTSGATIHIHYCMNELVSVSLSSEDEGNGLCTYCGMDKSKRLKRTGKQVSDCCKENKLSLKTDRDHRSGFSALDDNSFQTTLICPAYLTIASYKQSFSLITPGGNTGPPPLSQVRIYIVNCTFRI